MNIKFTPELFDLKRQAEDHLEKNKYVNVAYMDDWEWATQMYNDGVANGVLAVFERLEYE
ncbi:hypothetical protein EFL81_10135 [Weissella confusa]|uniref:hypothetical protein n=1 Tax=Weissella confusa TaxID=1583 RepID=UPI00223B6789|nr:hypothetical protein [Weissella confusa]MCS9997163.1 hypothetical protein [Weissella confusa]